MRCCSRLIVVIGVLLLIEGAYGLELCQACELAFGSSRGLVRDFPDCEGRCREVWPSFDCAFICSRVRAMMSRQIYGTELCRQLGFCQAPVPEVRRDDSRTIEQLDAAALPPLSASQARTEAALYQMEDSPRVPVERSARPCDATPCKCDEQTEALRRRITQLERANSDLHDTVHSLRDKAKHERRHRHDDDDDEEDAHSERRQHRKHYSPASSPPPLPPTPRQPPPPPPTEPTPPPVVAQQRVMEQQQQVPQPPRFVPRAQKPPPSSDFSIGLMIGTLFVIAVGAFVEWVAEKMLNSLSEYSFTEGVDFEQQMKWNDRMMHLVSICRILYLVVCGWLATDAHIGRTYLAVSAGRALTLAYFQLRPMFRTGPNLMRQDPWNYLYALYYVVWPLVLLSGALAQPPSAGSAVLLIWYFQIADLMTALSQGANIQRFIRLDIAQGVTCLIRSILSFVVLVAGHSDSVNIGHWFVWGVSVGRMARDALPLYRMLTKPKTS